MEKITRDDHDHESDSDGMLPMISDSDSDIIPMRCEAGHLLVNLGLFEQINLGKSDFEISGKLILGRHCFKLSKKESGETLDNTEGF
jgi:hypothetical protein